MDISISSHGIKISESMRELVAISTKKLVERHPPISARLRIEPNKHLIVTLLHYTSDNGSQKVAEFSGKTLKESLQKTVSSIEKQLKKEKEKK